MAGHFYKEVWTADVSAENGWKLRELKRGKSCLGVLPYQGGDKDGLRPSIVPGWRYCPCCSYAEGPEPCDDCVGMGMLRREGLTPREDRWETCATCKGKGEL